MQMTAVMKEKRLWKYVNGVIAIDEKMKEDDQAAAGFILGRVEFSQQDLVPPDASAKVTWDTLCQHHEKGGPQAKLLAFTQLMDAHYKEGDEMANHLDTIRELNNRLSSLQTKIEDDLLTVILLRSLNPSWSSTVQNISASSTLTFKTACATLTEEAIRRKAELARGSQSTTTALYAAHNQSARFSTPSSSGNRNPSYSNIICTYCGKPNHTENVCYSKHGRPPPRVGGKSQAHIASSSPSPNTTVSTSATQTNSRLHDMAYTATTAASTTATTTATTTTTGTTPSAHVTPGSTDARDTLVLDTGAAQHYFCRKDWLVSFVPTKNMKVIVGGGGQLIIEGIGDVIIPTPSSKDHTSTAPSSYTWKNVAYVPSLGTNLLSIGYAAATGHTPSFTGIDAEQLTLHSPDGRYIVAEGKRNTNHLYESVFKPARPTEIEVVACIAHGAPDAHPALELWHQRLAHLNHRAVIDLFNKNMTADASSVISDLTGVSARPVPHCEACVLGKQSRTDIPTSVTHRADRPLYRVHIDLCGPMTPARDGSLYLMLVVDDFTRFIWMAGLRTKDQAFEAFQRYVAMAEAEHNSYRVCCLRSDNGGEFISNAFNAWLENRGIRRELTTPHSPWQNGIVERMNRTVVEGSRTLLQDAKLPLRLWVLACYATVYCRNRSPSSTLSNSTPHELWYGVKPRHLHLRRFGCLAYAHILKEDRTKFAAKSEQCTFVGYSMDSSAYLLLTANGEKIVKSRDVHFVEHILGFDAKKTQSAEEPQQTIESDSENDDEETVPLIQPAVPGPVLRSASSPVAASPAPVSANALVPLNAKQRARMKTVTRQLSDRNTSGPADVAPSTIAHLAYIVHSSASIATDIENDTPTYREATTGTHSAEWKIATDSEIQSLIDAGTFTLCELPPGLKAIGCKWVLRIKRGAEAEIIKLKARLVAQGFLQRYGVDYVETYAPVARITSIRIIIALTAHHDWELHQMDVKSAYLNGDLEEEIYMQQPEGYAVAEGNKQLVWKLKKSLYGLKQAGRTWHIKIDIALKHRGFSTLPADLCVYVRREEKTIIVIGLYVDDLLIASNSLNDLNDFKKNLSTEFKMEDLGEAAFMLGVKITRNRAARAITISQSAYVTALLERHGMADCKPVSTPMEHASTVYTLVKAPKNYQASITDTRTYQSIIGGIMFAMLCTRPDISFAVTTLSQFASNPLPAHTQALGRVMRYLKGTIDYGITYTGTGPIDSPPTLIGFSDADWASSYDRKSITGYTFMACGGAISWQSKKQRIPALSTVEAEYMATTHASKEAIWWRSVFFGLGYDMSVPTILWSDSQGSISLAGNPEHHARTKHIDIQYHFIRQHLAERTISLHFIGTEDMAADGLTKALDRVKHEKGMRMLGMQRI